VLKKTFLSSSVMISVRDFNKVTNSIHVSVRTLFKAHLSYNRLNKFIPTLAFNAVNILDKKCNNFFIRNALSST